MKTVNLKDLEKLHPIFRAYRGHDGLGSWFRGQADTSWELLPKAGRNEFYLPENRDLGRFNDWCNHAIAYCSLPDSKIERLAIAQHHGLATRLLDWSMNPLVACYFACAEHTSNDAAVYILDAPNSVALSDLDFGFLTGHDGVIGFIPNSISPRVLNQKGLFTIHCDAKRCIEIEESRNDAGVSNLTKIVIPMALKSDILLMLDDYGINQVTLFPDIDGLSSHMNYKTLKMRRRT